MFSNLSKGLAWVWLVQLWAGSLICWIQDQRPSRCQEPKPDHGVAAVRVGGASEAVSRTLCSSCEGGTGDGLNFVQIVRSNPNLMFVFLGVSASNLMSDWQKRCWVPSRSKWSGCALGRWGLSPPWLAFVAAVNHHTRPQFLWLNGLAVGAALAFPKPQLLLQLWGMCADESSTWWSSFGQGLSFQHFCSLAPFPTRLAWWQQRLQEEGEYRTAFSGAVDLLGSAAGQGKCFFLSTCCIGGSSWTHQPPALAGSCGVVISSPPLWDEIFVWN